MSTGCSPAPLRNRVQSRLDQLKPKVMWAPWSKSLKSEPSVTSNWIRCTNIENNIFTSCNFFLVLFICLCEAHILTEFHCSQLCFSSLCWFEGAVSHGIERLIHWELKPLTSPHDKLSCCEGSVHLLAVHNVTHCTIYVCLFFLCPGCDLSYSRLPVNIDCKPSTVAVCCNII